MSKKYYIISGEASGDLHGSNLMKAILKKRTRCGVQILGRRPDERSRRNIGKTLQRPSFHGILGGGFKP